MSAFKPPVGSAPSLAHAIYKGGTSGLVSGGLSGRPCVWMFNEGGGKIVSSLASGGGWLRGSLVSSPTWTQGRFGGPALKFTGGAYVDTKAVSAVAGDSGGTIIAWVKPTAIGSPQTILASCQDNSHVLHFRIGSTGAINAQAFYSGGSVNDATNATTTTMSAGKWYQCVWQSDGTQWLFYVNTILQGTTQLAGNNAGKWFRWSEIVGGPSIRIGWDGLGTGANQPFTGVIDHVRILNRVLKQSEIELLYAQPFVDFPPSPVKRYSLGPPGTAAPATGNYRWFLMQ